MVDPGMDAVAWLRKQRAEECPDIARAMLERVVAELMSAEADALCGAPYGERSPERVNQRNGYRPRRWDTRAGDDRARDPEAALGQLLPRLADRPAPAGRKSAGGRDL
jgi:transposase-like protein